MARKRLTYGLTLDQLDTLDRLVQSMAAHGDVLAAGMAVHLDGRTLPVLGQAIYDAAGAAGEILEQVEEQRLGTSPKPSGVREAPATYGVEAVCPMALPRAGAALSATRH